MEIAQLWRYPVKSMAGERLEQAWLGVGGIPGDRVLYVVDEREQILSARTKPRLLTHQATLDVGGEVLVDGLPWRSREVAALVRAAAGPGARLVQAAGAERFDILPLLVVTDGAIAAFGHDLRRLRPNIVIGGVEGLAERDWEWSLLAAGEAVIALADLRGRCIMTTWHPDTLEQDVTCCGACARASAAGSRSTHGPAAKARSRWATRWSCSTASSSSPSPRPGGTRDAPLAYR
jgi:uncharacterized protein YcbX